jgi:hypothetical protein
MLHQTILNSLQVLANKFVLNNKEVKFQVFFFAHLFFRHLLLTTSSREFLPSRLI